MKITIEKGIDKAYPDRVRAHLDDDEGIQGVSNSHSYDHIAEAIGNLVLNHPDKFNVAFNACTKELIQFPITMIEKDKTIMLLLKNRNYDC